MTTNTALIEIKRYVQAGFYVFPVNSNSKIPFENFSWNRRSSNIASDVDSWAQQHPNCNWAIDCGKSGLCVIDVDVKEGALGLQSFENIKSSLGLPSTFSVKTPSGGYHHYFKGVTSNRSRRLGNGIDVRSQGGYVLAPGSSVEGKPYAPNNQENIANLPPGLALVIGPPGEREEDQTPLVDQDTESTILLAVDYLLDEKRVPLNVGPKEGNSKTYQVACQLRDYGVSEVVALRLMEKHWNPVCGNPRSFHELKTTVRNAFRYGQNAPGKTAYEAEFPAAEPEQASLIAGPKRAKEYVGRPPKRKWIVENWVPIGEVSSLYGDGGVGKSLLAMQLARAVAGGHRFLDMPVIAPMPVLAVMAEDSDEEIHRRLYDINNGIIRGDPPLYFWSLAGNSAELADVEQGRITPKPFLSRLKEQLTSMGDGPKLLILDTLADVFIGNENDRQSANKFIKVVIGGLIKEHNATLLLLAHPSLSGKNTGSYTSGSTAWNNAVRNRLVLRPHDNENAPNFRVLECVKSNYSKSGNVKELIWEQGVLKALKDEGSDSVKRVIMAQYKEIMYGILVGYAAVGNPVGSSPSSRNPLRSVHITDKSTKRQLGKSTLDMLINALLAENRIKRAGSNSNRGLWPIMFLDVDKAGNPVLKRGNARKMANEKARTLLRSSEERSLRELSTFINSSGSDVGGRPVFNTEWEQAKSPGVLSPDEMDRYPNWLKEL